MSWAADVLYPRNLHRHFQHQSLTHLCPLSSAIAVVCRREWHARGESGNTAVTAVITAGRGKFHCNTVRTVMTFCGKGILRKNVLQTSSWRTCWTDVFIGSVQKYHTKYWAQKNNVQNQKKWSGIKKITTEYRQTGEDADGTISRGDGVRRVCVRNISPCHRLVVHRSGRASQWKRDHYTLHGSMMSCVSTVSRPNMSSRSIADHLTFGKRPTTPLTLSYHDHAN